jgi:hypothetical protein
MLILVNQTVTSTCKILCDNYIGLNLMGGGGGGGGVNITVKPG